MTDGLRLTSVTLTRGDGDQSVMALDAVTLEVRPSEIVAVAGPSGSGKSSLLAVAGALTSPESGEVRVAGVDVVAATPRQRTRLRRDAIGFVFQSTNLVPALTALDQIRLPRSFGGTGDFRDPLDLLREVGMEHKTGRRPHELSGGERQRIGIARALVARPQVLLVDEPTAALDRQRSHEIVELLARETHHHGVATVMVTHDVDVLSHCDRIVDMVDGRLTPR